MGQDDDRDQKDAPLKPSGKGPVSEAHEPVLRNLLRRGRRQLERAQAADDEFGNGLVALYEKRYAEAIRLFDAVLRSDPDRADARYYLGLTRFMEGDYDAAVADFAAAIEGGYGEAYVVQTLADALFLLERYEEAVEAYRVALKREKTAEGYARMAQALSLLGQRNEAVDAYKEALMLKLAGLGSMQGTPDIEPEEPSDPEDDGAE